LLKIRLQEKCLVESRLCQVGKAFLAKDQGLFEKSLSETRIFFAGLQKIDQGLIEIALGFGGETFLILFIADLILNFSGILWCRPWYYSRGAGRYGRYI